jgi:Flp pilus assembly protein TadD
LSTAVRLDPGMAQALLARGWLLQRMGRFADALTDLSAADSAAPGNAVVLQQMGVAYLSLDRADEGEKALRRAMELSPDQPETLMHLGRALLALGRDDEGKMYLQKFQKVRPQRIRGPLMEPGMLQLATLPPARAAEREIERLQASVQDHPDDGELKLHLAELLLANDRKDEAKTAFASLADGRIDHRMNKRAGLSLLRNGEYALAEPFLRRAAEDDPALLVDLSLAVSRTAGHAAGLGVLDNAPQLRETPDFLLARARLLDASGRSDEAAKLLGESTRGEISRPEIAHAAAVILFKRGSGAEAVPLLDRALAAHAGNAELLLARATALALTGEFNAAEKAAIALQSKWPEWDQPYVLHGLLLNLTNRKVEAREKLQTAAWLGAGDSAATCTLESWATQECSAK